MTDDENLTRFDRHLRAGGKAEIGAWSYAADLARQMAGDYGVTVHALLTSRESVDAAKGRRRLCEQLLARGWSAWFVGYYYGIPIDLLHEACGIKLMPPTWVGYRETLTRSRPMTTDDVIQVELRMANMWAGLHAAQTQGSAEPSGEFAQAEAPTRPDTPSVLPKPPAKAKRRPQPIAKARPVVLDAPKPKRKSGAQYRREREERHRAEAKAKREAPLTATVLERAATKIQKAKES